MGLYTTTKIANAFELGVLIIYNENVFISLTALEGSLSHGKCSSRRKLSYFYQDI
jgi:hypothetical protein